MTPPTIIVSNPPHRKPDFARAGPLLNLAPDELKKKANYSIPEIWLSDSDNSKIEEAALALGDAGLSVVTVAGNDLATVPPREFAQSFSFSDASLRSTVPDGEVNIAYEAPAIIVFCLPHEESEAGGERATSWDATFVDVYFAAAGAQRRIGFVQGRVDLAGPGDPLHARAADSMAAFVTECESRFTQAQVDRRLVEMYPRKPTELPPGARKGLSYTTAALETLLESISPALKNIGQLELASRLTFLTRR